MKAKLASFSDWSILSVIAFIRRSFEAPIQTRMLPPPLIGQTRRRLLFVFALSVEFGEESIAFEDPFTENETAH